LGRRVGQVEEQLTGGPLTADEIEQSARLATEVVTVGDDQRASAVYRSQLVRVAVRRALAAAAGTPEATP
jgi:CO/xanthine dehydrogenase FAD-binding subunit